MEACVKKLSPELVPAQQLRHASNSASPLQTLPDDIFAVISALLLAPLDQMYTPYGCARAIASLGRTYHHFRLVMQRLWPVRAGSRL